MDRSLQTLLIDDGPSRFENPLVVGTKLHRQFMIDEIEIRLSDHLRFGAPHEPLELTVAGEKDSLRILQPDQIRNRVHQHPELALA